MGGIAAIFHRQGRPVDADQPARMAGGLSAHGPDGVCHGTDGASGWVHAQHILTTEDRIDAQPVHAAEGRLRVLFEGRLDNRDALIRALGVDSGRPDSVLAAMSWVRWGQDAVDHWTGPHAAIVFDRADNRLFAMRSPMGHRVLHYHLTPSRIALASAPQALFALGDVPRELDRQKIADALCRFPADASRTYFANIRRVCPGEMLTITPDNVHTRQFYRLEDRIRPVRYKRDSDYVDAAREHLDRAVAAHLRAARPAASLISGGFDSSAIAATAAGLQGALTTYTAVPDPGWDGRTPRGVYGDETPYVQAIAAHVPGIAPTFVDAAGQGFYHRMDARLRAMAGPVRNAMNIYWMHAIMEQARSAGTRVLLDGSFGNTTFSFGGGDLLAGLARQGRIIRLLREGRAAGGGLRGALRMFGGEVMLPLGPDWLWRLRMRQRDRRFNTGNILTGTAITAQFADETQIEQRIQEARAAYAGNPLGRMTHRSVAMRTMSQMAPPELGDIVQGLMAQHGVELRDPYAHAPLVEWTMGLPDDQFRRGEQRKWLIKRLMKGRLPDRVLNKPAPTGRQTPDWHVRLGRDLNRVHADLDEMQRDAEISGMIDVARLRHHLDRWPDEGLLRPSDPRLMMLSFVLPHAIQVARFIRLFRTGA